MTYGLTSSGFNRKRLVDTVTDLETALKLVFGNNIDLDPESGFGQFVGIMSEAIANEWESQENIYNSQYPSSALKVQLSQVVTFNGIERQEEIKSTLTNVTLSGIVGTIIPAGSQAAVTLTEEVFETDSLVTIGSGGTIAVDMTATIAGPITAAINTLTEINTPIYGWTGVTNPTAATVGRDEETDPALKLRRALSTGASASNLEDSLFAQLLNLDDVTGVLVISNRTAATVDGIPAYQFLTVVKGGLDASIAAIIWANTPQGIASYGTTTVQHTDTQGFIQDVKFTRPSDIPIYFKVNITTNSLFPATGEADIKAAIAAFGTINFNAGADVLIASFYAPIYETPGIVTIALFMGLSASPSGTANLTIDIDEISTYAIGQVEVNVS